MESFEENRIEDVKNKESLKPVLEVLKRTVSKFRELKRDAEDALEEGMVAKYEEKLKERAELLTELPDMVEKELNEVKDWLKNFIERKVSNFAEEAKEALEKKYPAELADILLSEERKFGEKNELEKLVEFLER